MLDISTPGWDSLERWSAAAFLVAGGLLVADILLVGVQLVGVSFPHGVLYSSGLVVSLMGLLGLYPHLAVRAPWVARASAVVIVLPVGAIFAILISTQILPFPRLTGTAIVLVGMGTLYIWGFTVVGVAILYTGVPSRTVGLLLLAIVATVLGGVILALDVVGGDVRDRLFFTLVVILPVLLLAVGYLVRTGSVRPDRATHDSTG